MSEAGLGFLMMGISGLLVSVGALYVFIRFAAVLEKLERKLD